MPDLVIGTRRPRSHNAMRGVAVAALLLVIGIAWILVGLREQAREIARLSTELEEVRHLPPPPNDRLADARRNLAAIIAEQFAEWELSKSEQEVGLLMLKGLTLKEIALLRGTAEKTIRQQASAVYQKAGVTGRHAFAAWFIEDFL